MDDSRSPLRLTTRRRVVIFGTTDYARIAHVYLREDSPHTVVAFTVDDEYRGADAFCGLPLVPFEEVVERFPPDEVAMLVAIGFSRVNKARAAVYERCKAAGYTFVSYINSKATHWGEIEIGDNSFVFEENVLQPFVRLGNDVVLWSGNHIGHDTTIGDHCFIASHVVISGNVSIGDSCFVGVNATFRDGVTVAPECVIGAGAVVMKDTERGDVLAVRGTEPIGRKSWELKDF
jgi:sugar O-acyltransferase (sialic acid O-acetyltransferase NeuD family)